MMKTTKRSALLRRGAVGFAGIILVLTQPTAGTHGGPQSPKQQSRTVGESGRAGDASNLVERAISTICAERAQDGQASVPIDEMAAHPPLPLTDSRVKAGRKRAEHLLPLARKLAPRALDQLAAAYNLEALSRDWIKERVDNVRSIKVEVDKHDNALWRPSEPHVITFGPVFLAGLRSDEAMIMVLAHELTHAVDGTDGALRPLVRRVGTRASYEGQLSVKETMAAELTCELVGLRVMQDYTSRTSPAKAMRQRLTRALGKDCVRLDLADENHLSPRKSMRLLLTLEPGLARAIVGVRDEVSQE